jgi:hypothetical protein
MPLTSSIDWPLPDPKGRSMEEVRGIRDAVKAKVLNLIQAEKAGK